MSMEIYNKIIDSKKLKTSLATKELTIIGIAKGYHKVRIVRETLFVNIILVGLVDRTKIQHIDVPLNLGNIDDLDIFITKNTDTNEILSLLLEEYPLTKELLRYLNTIDLDEVDSKFITKGYINNLDAVVLYNRNASKFPNGTVTDVFLDTYELSKEREKEEERKKELEKSKLHPIAALGVQVIDCKNALTKIEMGKIQIRMDQIISSKFFTKPSVMVLDKNGMTPIKMLRFDMNGMSIHMTPLSMLVTSGNDESMLIYNLEKDTKSEAIKKFSKFKSKFITENNKYILSDIEKLVDSLDLRRK